MSTGTRMNYTDIALIEIPTKDKDSTGFDESRKERVDYWKINQEQEMSREDEPYLEGTKIEEDINNSITMPAESNQEHNKIDFPKMQLAPSISIKPDQKGQLILRTHFANQILADLNKIQKHCRNISVAVYVDSLLRTMRAMEELSPYDPYIEVVIALHDALAYKNNWDKFSAEQYKGAYRVLKELAKRQRINNDIAEKAIMKLEELGFDTTPFRLDIDFKNKIENED